MYKNLFLIGSNFNGSDCFSFLHWLGYVHENDCPLEPKIPTYLIVGGIAAVCTFFTGSVYVASIPDDDDEEEDETGCKCTFRDVFTITTACITVLLLLFAFAWYICGCVWLYRVFKLRNDKNCDNVLFWFAFTCLQLAYLILLTVFKVDTTFLHV